MTLSQVALHGTRCLPALSAALRPRVWGLGFEVLGLEGLGFEGYGVELKVSRLGVREEEQEGF